MNFCTFCTLTSFVLGIKFDQGQGDLILDDYHNYAYVSVCLLACPCVNTKTGKGFDTGFKI